MDALVIRRSCLGDVLSAEPFARTLAFSGKYSKVYFETENYDEVLMEHPNIEIWHDQKFRHECEVYDLTGIYEKNLGVFIIDAYGCEYQLVIEDKHPRLYLSDVERAYAKDLMGDDNWAVIDIGYPNGPLERGFWPFSHWAPICQFLRDKGLKVVFIGNRKDVIPGDVDLNMRCNTTLRQMFSIIHRAKVFVGMDSGPMHVAQSFNIPGVGVFNPRHRAECLILPNSSIRPIHIGRRETLDCNQIQEMLGELI